jgi:hypothetical protein
MIKIKTWYLSLCMAFAVLNVEAQTVADKTNGIALDFNQPIIATTLPQIDWQLPTSEYSSSTENRIDFKARVVSVKPLKTVRIAVVRSLQDEPQSYLSVDLESKVVVDVSRNIYLPNGQNYVKIIAENEEGGIVSDYRSVIVGLDAISEAIAVDRKDYAILFATDNYDNWNDLVNPIYDATAIGKELEERYGFEVKIVENADNNKVLTTLREYAGINFKPQDQLFIFFAGHGQYDDVFGEGYVVARNSLANDPSKNSYISHNRLRNNINNINCDHIVLVMDVCFGGTFDPVLASSRSVYEDIDNTEYIIKKLSTKGRKFLTSGSKEYVSDGVAGKHSPFAVRFLEALKSNGGEDQLLTFTEINLSMQKLKTTPRYGGFGSDEAGSEFLFLKKQ